MNYEQKHNGAIESIKRIYNQADSYGKELMEKEFPELRESEDERIRKSLIKGFQHYDKECKWGEFTTTEILSWLEKQGEKTIPKNIDDAALQYVDTCAVDVNTIDLIWQQ